MNRNQIIKPRLILSGLLILALLAVTLMKHNVFAADTPNTFEVETADELTTAIEQASGGDTIILNTWLNITESMIIGDDAKHLTIKKGSTDAHFNVMGGSDTTFKNMTFDGDNMKTYDPWLHINSASVNVVGCTFQNMGEKENESNQYASAGAVTVTPTDTTGTQAVTNSPTNTTDNHLLNTTTDNRSTDNRTSDSHNTVDNSDRSDYSKVTNNTTNNYYHETKPSAEQQTGKPSGQETGQSSGVVLADVSDGQKDGLYLSGGKSLANGSNAPESAYMKATGQQETDEAPKEQENNFDIDLTDANIRIKANGSGGYDVVVRDAEKVTNENHETESTSAPFPVLDALQIGLLSAIFLCLIWDRKKGKITG